MNAATFETMRRYPGNLLAGALYRLRSRLGLLKTAEKRQELVGPAHLWRMKRDFQISFLKAHSLRPDQTLLDLGCGVLRGGLALIEFLDPGHYWGFEVRPSVLEEGRKALAESGLTYKHPVLLTCDSLDGLSITEHFDFVWAFSVLIHMSDQVLDRSFAWTAGHLQPEGRFYANVITDIGTDGDWQGFPVVHRSLDFYSERARVHGLHIESLGSLGSLGHVSGSRTQDNQIMLEFRLE